ncbi:hypothetical protein NIES2104_25210 [Leptolyngbya sp. NIES-2104]|nr:hypothetical protein NIES2104_25210 [Leptolyngbya sp. NIES-2104]
MQTSNSGIAFQHFLELGDRIHLNYENAFIGSLIHRIRLARLRFIASSRYFDARI